MEQVDQVDIGGLFGADGADRGAADAALWHGLRRTGSVILTGFPGAEEIDRRARRGLDIFHLPQEQKRALTTRLVAAENPNWYRGYWPITPERYLRNDFYDVGPENPHSVHRFEGMEILTEETPWPDPEPSPNWSTLVRTHYDHLNTVAMALILSLGRSAGFDESTVLTRFDGSYSTLRFLNYGQATQEPIQAPDGTLLAAIRHTDASGLSLLWQEAPGLQAEGKDGIFREIPAMENAISVHVGDVMTSFTNGAIPATPHRVLASDAPRRSVGFFLEPALDAPLTPGDHDGETGPEDSYAWHLLRTFAARPQWQGVIRDPGTT